MAVPTTRAEFKEYCLRKLGKPVLEINVDDDQISDCIDDGLQYFQERHYDGVIRMYLKYQFTEQDIARFKSSNYRQHDIRQICNNGGKCNWCNSNLSDRRSFY